MSENQNRITIVERMISACSGSLLTSMVLTPLDVVRVRLQQQEILLPDSGCCKRQVFWAPQPVPSLDPSCARDICVTDYKRTNGTWKTMLSIYNQEGVRTLWRGLSLTLLMSVPANIVYFTGYEVLRENIELSNSPILNPLICGSLARILAGTVVSPIELLKTRLQSIPNTSPNAMSELLGNIKGELSLKGPKVLFKGLSLTLFRDVPFSGIYWTSYEHFKKFFNFDSLFFNSFLSGSVSGTIAAIATNPFDVGKTRLQISNEMTLTKKEKSVIKFMSDIVKYEGVHALYVGLFPRILKIAPSCAIMISTYEVGKRFFEQSSTKK
ncbi:hypothetical protein WICMUC_002091 [Wickerhamomyces mucosus]|uniref:Mitochondrial carrier protein MTM1 n=1 Tax=Wickerhamomyces mucosus TaxID=1378264 RepID=A0A9P8TF48_9ASCO|nr:hypothetical protein WICMUC_002091 [Wickerhamomyces mucosus]